MRLADIKIGTRTRKDLGDIAALAASIERIGLLQPPVVDGEGRLIAGARRIAALKSLGRSETPVTVVKTLHEAHERLIAERDENTCREALPPSASVEIARRLRPLETRAAKARQRAGQKAGGEKAGKGRPIASASKTHKLKDRAADRVADGTGMSATTLRKAEAVVEAAEADPELAPLVEKMDKSGNVNAAFKDLQKHKEHKALVAAAETVKESVADLRICRMEELLPELSDLDAIITDPPYSRKHLPLYGRLAEMARVALKPVGILAVMCGQSYLPEILNLMTPHIDYAWMVAYLTPGGQSAQLWQRKVNTFWKPVLIFGSRDHWIGDVVRSRTNDNDKRFHGWGQSESGMLQLVEALTKPGDHVCDPFLGGGTTGLACVALHRRFVGCDPDGEAVSKADLRIRAASA